MNGNDSATGPRTARAGVEPASLVVRRARLPKEPRTHCLRRPGGRVETLGRRRAGLNPGGTRARFAEARAAASFRFNRSNLTLTARNTWKNGQGDRTCTCMISLPRGVADCLAPHPGASGEPVRSRSNPGRPSSALRTTQAAERTRSGGGRFHAPIKMATRGRLRRLTPLGRTARC